MLRRASPAHLRLFGHRCQCSSVSRDTEDDLGTGYRLKSKGKKAEEVLSADQLQDQLLQGHVNRKPWQQSRWRVMQDRQPAGSCSLPITRDYWYRAGTEHAIELGEGTRCVQSEFRCNEDAEISVGKHVFVGERSIIHARSQVRQSPAAGFSSV